MYWGGMFVPGEMPIEDFKCTFPIDWAPNLIPFDVESC